MTIQVNREMIVLARESRGMTQTELADRAGISQSKVSKFENGLLGVGVDDLRRLADALQYPPEFFGLTDKVYGFGSVQLQPATYERQRQRPP